ncbi:MAG: iron(III) transport system ATP-binding protein [Pseudonocardiales bacterium]|nr:iron(III) transport system ATP-binding protein [Pseudonocardiales bacterium]
MPDASRVEAVPDAMSCTDLGVDYAGVPALDGVGLEVAAGEFVAVLGASGSGKSTLLHAIAGLLDPDRGEIRVGGVLVASPRVRVPPERRAVGMVFQDFALWPHLSVRDTVAYPLRRAGCSRRDAAAQAGDLLARLGIEQLAARRPAQLSGGEQQRVGLARALARNAGLYLLDEPTAHLDTHLRAAFLATVAERRRESAAGALFASHDAGEALAVADRVAVVAKGRLAQVGPPATVYARPADKGTADLTGRCSVLTAPVLAIEDDGVYADLGEGPQRIAGGGVPADPRTARLLVRPDWVRVGGPLRARVAAVAFAGPHTDYLLASAIGEVLLRLPGPPAHAVGSALPWAIDRAWALGDVEPGPAGSAEGEDRAGVVEPVVHDVEV